MSDNSKEMDDIKRLSRLDAQAQNNNPIFQAREEVEYDDYEETNIEPELRKDIEAVLNVMVRPKLAEDGGDLEVSYLDEDGTLWINMLGGCHGCPSADDTAKGIVAKELVCRIPQIKSVEIDDGLSEEFLKNALDSMLSHRS